MRDCRPKTRNSNIEIRNKFEIRILKSDGIQQGHEGFFSNFVFRISNFISPSPPPFLIVGTRVAAPTPVTDPGHVLTVFVNVSFVIEEFVTDELLHVSRASSEAGDTIDRLPQLQSSAGYVKQAMHDKLTEHREYIVRHGEDLPEIRNWRWGA